MPRPKQFDVFLSHHSVDKPWAITLKDALRSRGLAVWLDRDEIRPGDLFVSALESGLEESKAVVLIVSPESMKSKWVKEEYSRALALAQDKRRSLQLVPLVLRDATLPGFLANRSWVEFRNVAEFDANVEQLVWGITGRKSDTSIQLGPPRQRQLLDPRAASETVLHNLPQPEYGNFVGRENEIIQINRILRPYPHSQHALVTIDGIGGVGKTALALEIAHRHLLEMTNANSIERFAAIVWTSAKQLTLSAEGLRTRKAALRTAKDLYSAIGSVLHLDQNGFAGPASELEIIRQALAQKRTLLVVDNLETIDDQEVIDFLRDLPAPSKAIVTTRHRIDVAYPIRLTGMDIDDAQLLIGQECRKKAVNIKPNDIRRLYARTGGVPLAIVWSVAQISWGHTIDGVLTILGQPTSDIARFCFDRAIEIISGLPPHELLRALSCFDTATREQLSFVSGLSELDRDEGLVALEKLSLINHDGERFTMLPLTREYIKADLATDTETTRRLESGLQRWVETGDTRFKEKYLDFLVRQHHLIRFSGMAVVDELSDVDMARVFVLPRLTPQPSATESARKMPLPVFVNSLLTAKKASNRVMILGGPGSGKTTLLEAFALAFVHPGQFAWAREFPRLLPFFYRVRDLDKDLLETRGTIWDCLQHQCSRRMEDALPAGFFQRQMQSGGLALLFDGLDEVSSLTRRNEIKSLIDAFASKLAESSRLVVTSRPDYYRDRFDEGSWVHADLAEFDDTEIQAFIAGWQKIHQPDRAAAQDKGKDLWDALKSRRDILPLARNALLLTMIVRVHIGLGALPESRLGLYEKCTETLLKHWAEAKGLAESPIDTAQKRKLLQRLAYEMQGEAELMLPDMALQISRSDLARRLEIYLKEEGWLDAFHLVEKVIESLHARDAILVQYGADQRGQDRFGFVHRSFQEYFAAGWLANEVEEDEFRKQLFAGLDGWHETLYLAVAQLPDKRRSNMLLELLKCGRAEFAVECLKVAAPEQPWLRLLVQFLARYTTAGREYRDRAASKCADVCAQRSETWAVLAALFERENREGRSLAAAVELAEELRRRGEHQAAPLLDQFFSETANLPEDMVEIAGGTFPYGERYEMVHVAPFKIDRHPVTNEDYERMVPGHRKLRNEISDTDRQPVIYVNWFEARLYARWRGLRSRLPTEQEWEKAASGWDPASQTKGVYPWGHAFDSTRCNTFESGLGKTTPVDAYPQGSTTDGVQDMAGNVCEWTESRWTEGSETHVIRGGSWYSDHDNAACAYRNDSLPDNRDFNIGFRCART